MFQPSEQKEEHTLLFRYYKTHKNNQIIFLTTRHCIISAISQHTHKKENTSLYIQYKFPNDFFIVYDVAVHLSTLGWRSAHLSTGCRANPLQAVCVGASAFAWLLAEPRWWSWHWMGREEEVFFIINVCWCSQENLMDRTATVARLGRCNKERHAFWQHLSSKLVTRRCA